MNKLQLFGASAIVFAMSSGCMVHAQGTANAEAEAPIVYTSRPTLVAIGSGVWVVRASARATYFVDGQYWLVRDGVWYRSSTWNGGWVTVQAGLVPVVIVHRDHSVYVEYQGEAGAVTKPAPGNDYVATADPPTKKNDDALPGVGNKRKDAGEQPGEVGKGLTKDAPKAEAKAEKKPEPKAEKAPEKKPEKKKK